MTESFHVDDKGFLSASRVREEQTTIPHRPVADVARQAFDEISLAIQRFAIAGVTVPNDSRLHQAKEVLATAVDSGGLVPEHRGDDLGLRALEIAFDYSAIASTLPKIRNAAFWRDLRDSCRGTLSLADDAARGPSQLQAQAIVRAAFVLAGLSPQLPSHSSRVGRSSPDLTLQSGSINYAVEVKRPEKIKNLLPRFRDARQQLDSYGLAGGILVDVTDCLRNVAGKDLDDQVSQLLYELQNEVFERGVGQRQEYSRVMAIGCFARAAWRSVVDERGAHIQVQSCISTGIFASQPNTLRAHRANWIRRGFQRGIDLLFERLDHS